MEYCDKIRPCHKLIKVGENLIYKKKFSVSNFQTLLNFFFEIYLQKKKKSFIFFLLHLASRLTDELSVVFLMIRLILGQKKKSFDLGDFDFILIDKIYFNQKKGVSKVCHIEFIQNRIFSRSFLRNFFLELEIYFEDKIIFPIFQNSLFKILLKIYHCMLSFLDDMSYHEHFFSFLKSKLDYIGDNFGFFQKEIFFSGNQFSFIDEITKFYEIIRIKIKYKKNNVFLNKIQIFSNLLKDLRSKYFCKRAENKIIIKKERKNFTFDLTIFNYRKKKKRFKNNFPTKPLWFKFQNIPLFSLNCMKNIKKLCDDLNFHLKIQKFNWSEILGKHSHYWGHTLKSFFNIFSCRREPELIKIYFFLSNLFLSKMKTFIFCIKKTILKIFQFSDWFSGRTINFFSEILVLCSKKSIFLLKWKKLTQIRPFFQIRFFLLQFSEKIKISKANHYCFLEIPKNFFLMRNIYFKKKVNYINLKYLNKIIFAEKIFFSHKKNFFQFENIISKTYFSSFCLFLFSILIPTTPLSSQIIFLEKYGANLRFFIDNEAKRLTGIKTLFILKSGFPFFDLLMFLERLNSYQIIDLCFIGRAIISETFFDENNLSKFYDIFNKSSSILKEKKTSAIVEKKFLKIYIQNIDIGGKSFIKKGFINLKKALVFFLAQIQNFESCLFENVNIQLNKFFFILNIKIFFWEKFYSNNFFTGFFKILSFFVKNFKPHSRIHLAPNIKTKKIEYLYD